MSSVQSSSKRGHEFSNPGGWNTTFLLGTPILRCYVSFRKCIKWKSFKLAILYTLIVSSHMGNSMIPDTYYIMCTIQSSHPPIPGRCFTIQLMKELLSLCRGFMEKFGVSSQYRLNTHSYTVDGSESKNMECTETLVQ